MAFCAICGTQHDPDVSCCQIGQQALQDMGIKRAAKGMSDERFKKIAHRSDRFVIRIMLFILAALALAIILDAILGKLYRLI